MCPKALQCWEELAAALLCVIRALLSGHDVLLFFMKQSPFRIYRMLLSLVSVDFAWWESRNISVIVGVTQLCSGTGAAPAPQELGTALTLCEL